MLVLRQDTPDPDGLGLVQVERSQLGPPGTGSEISQDTHASVDKSDGSIIERAASGARLVASEASTLVAALRTKRRLQRNK